MNGRAAGQGSRPPWQRVEVVEQSGGIEPGGRVTLRLAAGPLKIRWQLEHRDYAAGRQFRDVQLSGPFRSWVHTHSIEPDGPSACFLEDRIEYELPYGLLGDAAGTGFVRRQLERLFAYRHTTTINDLAALRCFAGSLTMNVAVSGASGMIGLSLTSLLTTAGHQIRRLVRWRPQAGTDIAWDPAAGTIDRPALAGCDAVVHLAGENIARVSLDGGAKAKDRQQPHRWHPIAGRGTGGPEPATPGLGLHVAIGFYGDRGDEELDEASPAGEAFCPTSAGNGKPPRARPRMLASAWSM